MCRLPPTCRQSIRANNILPSASKNFRQSIDANTIILLSSHLQAVDRCEHRTFCLPSTFTRSMDANTNLLHVHSVSNHETPRQKIVGASKYAVIADRGFEPKTDRPLTPKTVQKKRQKSP